MENAVMCSASVPHLSPSRATLWNSLPRISFVSYIAQQWSSKGNNFFASNCHGRSIILSLCVRAVIIISSCGGFFFKFFHLSTAKGAIVFFSSVDFSSSRRTPRWIFWSVLSLGRRMCGDFLWFDDLLEKIVSICVCWLHVFSLLLGRLAFQDS